MSIKKVLGGVAIAAGLVAAFSAVGADSQPAEKGQAAAKGRAHSYYFSFVGKRRTFEEDGVTNVEVVVPNDKSEGRYNVITAQWNHDFQVQPHYHKTHSETFYVLDGQVEWTVGGETHVLNKGDAVYIPPNTVHSIRVVGGKPMQNLMIYEPGGYENQTDFRMNYTKEQLKDPEIQRRVRAAGDFNLP